MFFFRGQQPNFYCIVLRRRQQLSVNGEIGNKNWQLVKYFNANKVTKSGSSVENDVTCDRNSGKKFQLPLAPQWAWVFFCNNASLLEQAFFLCARKKTQPEKLSVQKKLSPKNWAFSKNSAHFRQKTEHNGGNHSWNFLKSTLLVENNLKRLNFSWFLSKNVHILMD